MNINYYFLIIIIGLFIFSCKSQKKKSPHRYNLEIELAKHNFGESVDKGETSFEEVKNELDNYNWKEQVKEHNILERTAPTISVNNNIKNQTLFISGYGDPENIQYSIGTVLPINNKIPENRWVKIYALHDYAQAKYYFKLFFNNNITELETQLFKLQFIMEIEEFKG
jgi:hypothetical protein